ncbi:hypothetical protein B296_00049678 [Ensete ventricosum]|uniref:Uncharacterized protein n=1 Tax=Ensete ventricosum TaxID=4639 RepID=A0A426X1W3_ENSVE|nr:hypothetical protein B296_00049678 [Ensete ventricosum]
MIRSSSPHSAALEIEPISNPGNRSPGSLGFLLGKEEEWMASWRRSLGNLRTFVGNATGGLRGGANLASWVVAGTLAYFLWVKPAQDLKREQEARAAAAAASDPYRYVEKRRPIPDPQVVSFVFRNVDVLFMRTFFV